jgi:TfoX/Sxy family transcriptional regulator of competence genes
VIRCTLCSVAYDEALADRVRRALGPRAGVSEKKMFGGLAFLLDGKMFCGIVKDELMVRVGPERYEESLRKTHVRPMDFTGRPMNGYVYVGAAGCRTDKALRPWIELGLRFVGSLPEKQRRGAAGASTPSRAKRAR